MTPIRTRTAIRALTFALSAATLIGTLAAASPAMAAFHSPSDFNRSTVMVRARAWMMDSPPYSQTDWHNGYRQDCSGFISMVWGLGQSYVTWTLPDVAWPIHKDDLAQGDIMLNTAEHVVLFDRWADSTRTSYWEYEMAGSTGRVVHRVVPYPFWTSDRDEYKPYRFARAPQYIGHKPLAVTAQAKAPTSTPSVASTRTTAPSAAKPAKQAKAAKQAVSRHARRSYSPRPARRAAAPAARKPARAAKVTKAPGTVRRMQDAAQEPAILVLLRALIAWVSA